MSEEMRSLWSKEPCSVCGIEGYATRTEFKPVSEPYICGDCGSREMGRKKGYEEGAIAAFWIAVEACKKAKEDVKSSRHSVVDICIQRILAAQQVVVKAWKK